MSFNNTTYERIFGDKNKKAMIGRDSTAATLKITFSHKFNNP